jgi:predicted O-methyltransferase YrrM
MMSEAAWSAMDDYIGEVLLGPDTALERALAESRAAGLPDIAVSPAQGKMLMLLAQMQGARRILEIGTLGGYSAIWLARALPTDGELVTLEYEPRHAEVARRNLAAAGFAGRAKVSVGAAIDLLPTLRGPFDFVFVDADKASYPAYLEWSVKLSRPGGVIVLDNMVRAGRVLDPMGEPNAEGARRTYAAIAADPRLDATAIQTVGAKGWDGFCLVRVR